MGIAVAAAAETRKCAPEQRRIIIVDDNPADREVYRRLLAKIPGTNHEVIEAETAEDGLALCRTGNPDCVLLDYLLPDMDGLEFLAELSRNHAVTPWPVIMLTGQGDSRVDRAAIRAGAQDYLVKGETDIVLLQRTIRHAIERHELVGALRESEERVRAILETAPDGILTFDREGFIVSMNGAAEPLFGRAAAAVLGRSILTLIPNLYKEVPSLAPGRGPDAETVRVQLETPVRHGSGGTIPVEITLGETRWGEERMFTAIVRDITERKQAEQDHRLFLAATSHDVRNALTTILGYAHIVKMAPDPEQADGALQRITSLVRGLSTLMNDIVVHAASQDEQLSFSPVRLPPLLESITKDTRSECREQGIGFEVHMPEDCTVVTDRAALARSLQNLLNNAVRYTPEGKISLSCEATGSTVRFIVSDTGIGIPEEERERIFEEHYRSESARELEPLGTGLGLATVRMLCTAMGGTIDVESRVGKGSTFILTLPRNGPLA